MTGKRILVVEDRDDLCGVLCALLIVSGYAVLEAPDGQSCIARPVDGYPVASALMDLRPSGQSKGGSRCKAIIVVNEFAVKGDEVKVRAAITTATSPTARSSCCT